MYIARSKRDKYSIPEISIEHGEFIAVVNLDSELVWDEDTQIGAESYQQFPDDPHYVRAYFDFNKKKGWSNEQFTYCANKFIPNGYIGIQLSRMTCSRLAKILEVTEKLNANLYTSGNVIYTEKKIAKLREKFCKEK